MADIDQQPSQDLSGKPAIKKIQELGKKSNISLLHTGLKREQPSCRPMALQEADDQGNLWYLSSSESGQNEDIKLNSQVTVTFQNNSDYEYLVLHGDAEIITKQATINKYWTDFANAWFEGKDDPRLTVIKVKLRRGRYWDTKDGKIVSSFKMIFAALGAEVDDGGISGELKL